MDEIYVPDTVAREKALRFDEHAQAHARCSIEQSAGEKESNKLFYARQ